MSLVSAQTRLDYLEYMKEHGVSLLGAARGLGSTGSDAVKAFGYEGFDYYFQASADAALVFADCVEFYFYLQGTAERLGVSAQSLMDIAMLRHRSDLSFLPLCGTDYDITRMSVETSVWTVGDDFPVAFHLETTTFMEVPSAGIPERPFRYAVLGYTNAAVVPSEVEDYVEDMIRALALKAALNQLPRR